LAGGKKSKSLDATQAGTIKHPQPQAQIELLDSEDSKSGNETARSANPNGTERYDTELSNAENY
jgi:hypothetical protein